jgi:hypothetical protein
MKMYFKHKTRIKVDHRIKDIIDCDFLWSIFCHEFYIFGYEHFFSFIVVCTHLKCYTISDVHLIMCAFCEKKIDKISELNDKKMYYSFQCSFSIFSFLTN